MNYYRLNTNGENKIWRKYFTFAERFILNENEVKAIDFIMQKSVNNIKIQALSNGNVVKNESFFTKEKMPEFSKIENVFFIKEDIIDVSYFSNLNGINFIDIEVDGIFSKGYKLLSFDMIIDCIDEINSKKGSFEFFSTLVLDSLKIPVQVDGFFLKNWSRYGEYITIVNEKLKNCLLRLPKSNDFLIFNEIKITENI